jgi:hypothetical protein
MAALFLQAIIGELAALWDGPYGGGLRPANCGLRSFFILAGKRWDLSNILYISLFMTWFLISGKGGIPYEEKYYLSDGRGGFGLRAGVGLR